MDLAATHDHRGGHRGFSCLSGAFNPLHVDAERSKSTQFGERVAHGLLGLSIATGRMSKIGIIEGTAIAFLGFEEKLEGAITIGEHDHVAHTSPGQARDVEARLWHRRFENRIVNQRDEVVQEGVQTMMRSRRCSAVMISTASPCFAKAATIARGER